MPKVVDRECRRGFLAGAAARVVARIGLEGVTFQAVAREANCSPGSIAHYFRNKDELLVQALYAASESLLRPLREPSAPFSSLDSLRAIARESLPLDAARERDWRVRLAFWTRASGPPEEVQLARDHFAAWRALWEAALREVQARGGLPAGLDSAGASADLVALIVGTATQLLVRPRSSGAPPETSIDSYLARLGSV